MSIFQLAYLSRLNETEAINGVPIARRRSISGVLLYKAPSVLHVMEGDAADLCDSYEHVCRDARHEDVCCILFRPVAQRMFVGFETNVIDGRSIEDHPRPIDLWAALNLEHPEDAIEECRQVREAIAWFGGRLFPQAAGQEPAMSGEIGTMERLRAPEHI